MYTQVYIYLQICLPQYIYNHVQKYYRSYIVVCIYIFVHYIHISIYSLYAESILFLLLVLKEICHNFANLLILKEQELAKILKEPFEKHVT